MENQFVNFVKQVAAKNGLTYNQALKADGIRDAYYEHIGKAVPNKTNKKSKAPKAPKVKAPKETFDFTMGVPSAKPKARKVKAPKVNDIEMQDIMESKPKTVKQPKQPKQPKGSSQYQVFISSNSTIKVSKQAGGVVLSSSSPLQVNHQSAPTANVSNNNNNDAMDIDDMLADM